MKHAASIRRAWLRLIKYTLNPLTRRMARSGIGPFSLIRHSGRHSGKSYETPLVLAPIPDGFMIELTYGPVVDWYKNIVAAGGCTVLHRGQVYVIDQIERVETATGMAAFPTYQRVVLRLLRRTHFEKLRIRGS
ncbi:nitroreductase family deazaflavin-dependent oxidoreductase [Candidatus Oscillochloris fontis]|uniref:nitroreductase family deazaflavin-dependent oxidoreductase n=1 Tax=Candidatus Oscillochloris fontis TaxID=2496868 RepID=UPI00101CC4DF|nr:nitroreductase family deazaflavin-dependent oxidoreductase [Candidatus Oscillochloris fontis]